MQAAGDSNVCCDSVVEVAGFTDGAVSEFAHRFSSEGRDVSAWLKTQRLAWELAHIPVNCVLLCHVVGEQLQQGHGLPDLSLTALYSRVEQLLLTRYCRRMGLDVVALQENAPLFQSSTAPVVAALSQLALSAVQQGATALPLTVSAVDASPAQLLDSGFVNCETDSNDSKSYHFLHMTFCEYFAARKLAQALSHTGGIVLCDELAWLRSNRNAPRLSVLWLFVCGLLARAASTCAAASVVTLCEWWEGEPLTSPVIKLWLGMIEQLHPIMPELCGSPRWQAFHAAITAAARAEVLAALLSVRVRLSDGVSGGFHALKLPWRRVLRLSPLTARAVVFESAEVLAAVRGHSKLNAFVVADLLDLGGAVVNLDVSIHECCLVY